MGRDQKFKTERVSVQRRRLEREPGKVNNAELALGEQQCGSILLLGAWHFPSSEVPVAPLSTRERMHRNIATSLLRAHFGESGEARFAGSCEGMIETAMLFSPNLPADVRACPPAQGSILESAKVMLRYLDKNPDRISEPGITVAIEAFRDAWPCLGDDVASGSKQKKRAPKRSN